MHKDIATLHFLTQDLPGSSHLEQVETACRAGVKWIQLRVKDKPTTEWLSIAKTARDITMRYKCILIINDSPMIAVHCCADGVHIGQNDMHWSEARKLLGPEAIIGASVHSWKEMSEMKKAQIDYAGIGPLRFTATKQQLDPVLGKDGIAAIIAKMKQQEIKLPMIAIGGITLNDMDSIALTGVRGVAVSSAVNKAADPLLAARQFMASANMYFSKNEIIET